MSWRSAGRRLGQLCQSVRYLKDRNLSLKEVGCIESRPPAGTRHTYNPPSHYHHECEPLRDEKNYATVIPSPIRVLAFDGKSRVVAMSQTDGHFRPSSQHTIHLRMLNHARWNTKYCRRQEKPSPRGPENGPDSKPRDACKKVSTKAYRPDDM